MANKKYELMKDDTIKAGGKTLYRIRALRNIGDYVNEGDEGGYIESEKNLSQKGECWVRGDDSIVYGNAVISGDVLIEFETTIYGNAKISGDEGSEINRSTIYGNAVIENVYEINDSTIYGNARITDSDLDNNCEVCGNAVVDNCPHVVFAKITDNAVVEDGVLISGKQPGKGTHGIVIGKNTHIRGDVFIGGVATFMFPSKSDEISPDTVDPELIRFAAWNIYAQETITSSEQFAELAHPSDGTFSWGKSKKKLKQSMISQAQPPKKFSSPADEFKFWVKDLIDQCNKNGAGSDLVVSLRSGNAISFNGNYDVSVECEFNISGSKIDAEFIAEIELEDQSDGFWNIGEEKEYDENLEMYRFTLHSDVKINKKEANPIKAAAYDFLVDAIENNYIVYDDVADTYLEKLEEVYSK